MIGGRRVISRSAFGWVSDNLSAGPSVALTRKNDQPGRFSTLAVLPIVVLE